MGDRIQSAIEGNVVNAKENRADAVRIALELIKAQALGGGSVALSLDIDNLSSYANQIQSALKE